MLLLVWNLEMKAAAPSNFALQFCVLAQKIVKAASKAAAATAAAQPLVVHAI